MGNLMEPILIPEITKAAVEEVKTLLNKFLGPGFEEAGAMVGDRIRLVRFSQQLKLLRKAEEILKSAGLKPQSVNMKVLFPLLDAAAFEDNEDMAERWASLLAAAANPENQTALECSYIEILKQLAPTHAFVLDTIYDQIRRNKWPIETWTDKGISLPDLKRALQKQVPQIDVAIDNLLRLRLLAHPIAKLGVANGNDVHFQVTGSLLCPTSLGAAFVAACGQGRTFKTTTYCLGGNSISNLFWTQGGSLRIWSKEEETALERNKEPATQ
jgi:Abortive infection alpha